ncbi:MAG: response regulator [Alphaproteobacteria bacterium]|nr:response regulator [Alphaproteobacteria bacterium]MCD8570498.1 response regulator [Alphaproteobacteria bacterium]
MNLKAASGLNKEQKGRLASLKVLVVDDVAEIRMTIKALLSDLGISQVFEAGNGKEALQFIDTDFDMVDLIICDWNMPAMEGIDLLRQIRTVFTDTPFLMVTSRADKNSVVEAKAAGVTAYIRKPFSPAELESKIKHLCLGASEE